jgi:diamine N-acetyltransferase
LTARLPAPDVRFRQAVATDALCIGVLATQVFLDTYATEGVHPALAREVLDQLSTGAVAAALSAPRARCIVAERDEHLLGFALCLLQTAGEHVDTPRPAKLHRLYVQEPFTGTGLGSALLARAEDDARDAGATALWLTTWIGNRRALDFYPRRGYRDVGATDYVFEDERHENRVFVKSLDHVASPGATQHPRPLRTRQFR